MNRRSAILAALLGHLLPRLRGQGAPNQLIVDLSPRREEEWFNDRGIAKMRLKAGSERVLVIKLDEREVRLTATEIMDALEQK